MEFLNKDNVYDSIIGICEDALGEDYNTWESVAEDFAECVANSILEDMRKYVHLKDTKMGGNFANIREDWDVITDFVQSEIKPFGRFDDVVASIDNATISEEDLAKFQEWCLDWFYTAFGTYNIKYQNQTIVADMEYEESEEDD